MKAIAGHRVPASGDCTVFIARNGVQPNINDPDEKEFIEKIFPFVEEGERLWSLPENDQKEEGFEPYVCLRGFLDLLKALRRILAQDMCILLKKYPKLNIAQDPIWQSPGFKKFHLRMNDFLKNNEGILPRITQVEQTLPDIGAILRQLNGNFENIDFQLKGCIPDLMERVKVLHDGHLRKNKRKADYSYMETEYIQECLDSLMKIMKLREASCEDQICNADNESEEDRSLNCDVRNAADNNGVRSERNEVNNQRLPTSGDGEIRWQSDTVPHYEMDVSVKTLQPLWDEMCISIKGEPPVFELEKRFGNTWCGTDTRSRRSGSKFFNRRRKVVHFIDEVGKKSVKRYKPEGLFSRTVKNTFLDAIDSWRISLKQTGKAAPSINYLADNMLSNSESDSWKNALKRAVTFVSE